MCGRYAVSREDDELAGLYGALVWGDRLAPSWNVAPTDPVRVILERPPRDQPDAPTQRLLRTARWGLVPSWAKSPAGGARLINARAETVTEKPAFKTAALRRRCIVPADGYYEWESRPGGKQPFFLHLPDRVLSMAGLYELWPDPAKDKDDPERWLWTVGIVTTTASDALGRIHDRSPLVLPESLLGDWLDPRLTDPATVRSMVESVPEPALQPYPVSTAVNSVRNNGPALVTPVAD